MSKTLKKHLLLVLVGVLVLTLIAAVGCTQKKEPAQEGGGEQATEPIRIGIPLPLTGTHAKFGEMEKQSYEMAQEEINAAGGINGRPLELVIEDTGGKPETASAIAEIFITIDRFPIIVGAYSSQTSFAVAGVAERFKVPYLVVTGAADKITQQGWENVFRLNPPSSQYASGLNSFLMEVVKPKTMVILHESTDFGTSTADAMEKWAGENGIEVLLREAYEAGAIDFSPLLTKVKGLDPDVVYMVSYLMDASLLMKQSKELNFNPRLFAGGAAGFTLPEFIENAGDASEFVVSGTLWTPQVSYTGAKEYYENFYNKFGKYPDYHGAEAYAAAYVLADVLKRAEAFEPDALRKALAETNMMTAFGPVQFKNFDNFTNQNMLPTLVLQIIDGKFETIWPREAASHDYVYPIPSWNER